MGIATELLKPKGEFTGEARHFKLSPPLEGDDQGGPYEYVIVSATVAMFSGPETYIFPADADGNVTSWADLPGSYRGGLSHEAALAGAGYEVRP